MKRAPPPRGKETAHGCALAKRTSALTVIVRDALTDGSGPHVMISCKINAGSSSVKGVRLKRHATLCSRYIGWVLSIVVKRETGKEGVTESLSLCWLCDHHPSRW